MKRTILIALGAVVFGSMLAYAQTVYRGDMNLIDNAAGTSQFQVGGEDIIKALTFPIIDSLAENTSVIAVFTLPRAILVKHRWWWNLYRWCVGTGHLLVHRRVTGALEGGGSALVRGQ